MRKFRSATEEEFELIKVGQDTLNPTSQSSYQVAAKKVVPATLDDLLLAQNRTTHAVRSLAITFVAAPIISSLVVIGVVLAFHSGNTAVMIITGLIAVVASLGTLFAAVNELTLSKVD